MINIYLLAYTQLDVEETEHWLNNMGVSSDYTWPGDDGQALVGLAAKSCYQSFEEGINPNINKIRKDWVEYLDNVISSGHGSVLEHASCTFAISGCTRVFTAEMNRHRAGVGISERSMRYVRLDHGIDYWVPDSLQELETDTEEVKIKKAKSRALFEMAFDDAHGLYKKLMEVWDIANIPDFNTKKKLTSMFRRIVPMGVSTGVIYTMNFRALRHIMALRTHPSAEEEIVHVMSRIGKLMISRYPMIFGDFETDGDTLTPKHRKV